MGVFVVKILTVWGLFFFCGSSVFAARAPYHSWQSEQILGREFVGPVKQPLQKASLVAIDDDLEARRAQLIDTALSYLVHASVPYVWGGGVIGDDETCTKCAQCAMKYQKRGIQKRHLNCPECTRCGLDCSHFVHKVFNRAGFEFPFTSTSGMMKANKERPRAVPGLRYIGKDLRLAMPGDLLVLRKHVVILVRLHDDLSADVVHVSRSVRNSSYGDMHNIGKVGGIEYRRGVNLQRFYGGLSRILRHDQLHAPVRSITQTPQHAPAVGG